jgi:hypothetical protein
VDPGSAAVSAIIAGLVALARSKVVRDALIREAWTDCKMELAEN